MPTFDMRSYARRGAEARIAELKQELEAIFRAFPELGEQSPARGRRGRPAAKVVVNHEEQVTRALRAQEPAVADAPRRGKRRKMTAAERTAVGERMRKYWAARKAELAAKKR